MISAGVPRCFPQTAVTVEHLAAKLAAAKAPPKGITIVADWLSVVSGHGGGAAASTKHTCVRGGLWGDIHEVYVDRKNLVG